MRDFTCKALIIVVSACCAVRMFGCAGTPSTAYYQPPPSAPALSGQERSEMTEERINGLIEMGDEEYARENYSAAKDYYYRAMLAQSDPDPYVLASYAATLSLLGAFDNALEVFKMALAKDPDNEMIRNNIAICEELIQEEVMNQQMFEMQRRMDQIQRLINVAVAVRDVNREVRKAASSVSAPSSGGVQRPAQSQGGGGGDGGGGGGHGGRDYNCAGRGGALDKYRNEESAAQSAYKDLESDCSGSMAGYKKNRLKDAQSKMRSIRQSASQNGCSVPQSSWESKSPCH